MSFISTLPEGLASSLQQHMTQLPASVTYPGSESGRQTYLSRVPSLPENMYGTAQPYPQSTSLRTDTSGYSYHMPSHAESLKAPSSLGQHYFVDRMMNPHPYSSLYPGFDMNAVRRKNATRETTGPLKAWLRQHKKNPYPTKGEKVMLAIGTRMTLTQVSTWFANARRRMKKDKLDEDDDDLDVDFAEKRERSGSLSSRVSQSSSEADTSKDLSDLSDIDVEDVGIRNKAVKKCVQRLFSPDIRTDHMTELSSSPESVSEHAPITYQKLPQVSYLPPVSDMVRVSSTSGGVEAVPVTETEITKQKPKIWSISEIIGSATKTIDTEVTSSLTYETPVTQYGHYSGYYSTYPDMHSNYPYTSMSETTSGKVSSIQYL